MYVLDTNVVSELRKTRGGGAHRNVVAWAAAVPVATLYLSAITVLELVQGLLLIERRDPGQGAVLRTWLNRQVMPAFEDRILPVDSEVAWRCAELHIPNPRGDRDAMIAATALVHGMTIVTRNVVDFAGTGVPIINPWNP